MFQAILVNLLKIFHQAIPANLLKIFQQTILANLLQTMFHHIQRIQQVFDQNFYIYILDFFLYSNS